MDDPTVNDIGCGGEAVVMMIKELCMLTNVASYFAIIHVFCSAVGKNMLRQVLHQ